MLMTYLKVIASGYAIGLVCMSYLILRARRAKTIVLGGHKNSPSARRKDVNWLSIALLSMVVSSAWCILGVIAHIFANSAASFFQFSFVLVLWTLVVMLYVHTTQMLNPNRYLKA